jgi:Topoisomerase IA
MANRLFIIEAPGKEVILGRLLYHVFKQRCEIIATVGHICENPKSLDMPWINDDLSEHSYNVKPERQRLINKLRIAATIADEIYIATDDDHEGDVIGRDVVSMAFDSVEKDKLYRVKLRAMTIDEVRRAISERETYFPDANKGDARRILDRLIGRLSNKNGAVGRVQGSMLIELSSNNPVVGVAQLQIPSQDGGKPFCSSMPIFAGDDFDFDEINHLSKQLQIAPDRLFESTSSVTWNHSDILLNCSLSTGRPMASIAEAMQRLYEKGQMTYPRSSQRTVSSHSICKTQIIAKMQGVNFRPELVSNVRETTSHGHEAPSIIESDLPLNRRIDESTDVETAVKILIARNQVESGMPCRISLPEASSINALPDVLKNLQWYRRDVPGFCLWLEDKEPSF